MFLRPLSAPISDASQFKTAAHLRFVAPRQPSLELQDGTVIPTLEGQNSRTFRKLNATTGRLLAVNTQCNHKWHSDRPDKQCSNAVLDAAKSPHAPHLRPHSLLRKSAAELPASVKISSYFAACAARHSSCPVEWVTFMTSCSTASNRLIDMVTDHAFPTTVLGLGTLWRSRWGYRIRVFHDYLLTVPDNRIVIWTDADDVLLAPHTTIDSLLTQYHQLVRQRNGPTVFFPAETACYPDGHLWLNFTDPNEIQNSEGPSPFRYLNAGIMIGPASHLRAVIRTLYTDDCFDDQRLFSHAFLDPLIWWSESATPTPTFQISSSREDTRLVMVPARRTESPNDVVSVKDLLTFPPQNARPLIGLDYWNALTVALYGMEAKDVSYGPQGIMIPHTKGLPFVVHQNGEKSSNAVLEVIAQSWGLPSDADA
eukprot:jgi/Hompol1/5519/HPOL_004503-RA